MPDVRMPDGKVVRFPDEMPSTEIKAFIASKYPGAYDDAPQQEQGLVGRFAGATKDALDSVSDAATLGAAPYVRGWIKGAVDPEMTMREGAAAEFKDQDRRWEENPTAQVVGSVVGGGLTGAGLAKAGLSATRFIGPQSTLAQRAGAVGVDAAAQSAVQAGIEGEDPGAAATVGMLSGAGLGAVADGVGGMVQRGMRNRQVKGLSRSADEIEAAMQRSYGDVDASGLELDPALVDSMAKQGRSRVEAQGLFKGKVGLNTNVHGQLDNVEEAATRAYNKGGRVPWRNVENIRSNIVSDLRDDVIKGGERRGAGKIVDSLDSGTENAPPSMLSTRPGYTPEEALGSLKAGRAERKLLAKAEIIQSVIDKSSGYVSGEESGIRNGIASILRSDSKRAMFDPEEIEAMKKVVAGGPVEQFMRWFSRRAQGFGGVLVGAGAVGAITRDPLSAVLGGAALPTAGKFASGVADNLSVRGAMGVQDLVNAGNPAPTQTQQFLQSLRRDPRAAGAVAGASSEVADRDTFLKRYYENARKGAPR